jgi:hypothetical protein
MEKQQHEVKGYLILQSMHGGFLFSSSQLTSSTPGFGGGSSAMQ